jgi:manganese/zinc/iron transport system permease protein
MKFTTYFNPYTGQSFLGFFTQFFIRFLGFLKGDYGFEDLASDEIQILVLCEVALSAGIVGCFLVLRKMTMLANSLSHTILLGIVAVFVLTQGTSLIENDPNRSNSISIHYMLLAALIMGLVTTFLTEFLTTTIKLQEDASTGIIFTSLFALGIILATLLTRNAHIGNEVVMGNVDALHWEDVKLMFLIVLLNFVSIMFFFKEFKITTFDPDLACILGFSPLFFNYLLMIQTSATSIGAFRAVGVLMVLAFITGPALIARFLTNDLKQMLFFSAFVGILASFLGVAFSRHLLSTYDLALSTGGIVVCMIILLFLLTIGFKEICLGVSRKSSI